MKRTPATTCVSGTSASVSYVSEIAVVLMAYGSPERIADVPAYYADIRGGRPIAPEQLEDLVDRYRRLGIEESNPLNAITEATRAALETELGLPVLTGMKHWTPRIADAAESALASGATRVAGLVLAPHYSRLSIAGYRAQLEEAIAGRAELALERGARRLGDRVQRVRLLDAEPAIPVDQALEVLGRDRPAAADVGVVRRDIRDALRRPVGHQHDRDLAHM